jgi:predicted alpha/beta superfamily hydrolase
MFKQREKNTKTMLERALAMSPSDRWAADFILKMVSHAPEAIPEKSGEIYRGLVEKLVTGKERLTWTGELL